jgi:co-chaperonin GroES (HSP10)
MQQKNQEGIIIMIEMYGERVICKRVGSNRETSSGVIKTSSNKEKPLIVKVVSSGISDIVEGEELLVARYSGMEIEFKGDDFVILEKSDILGKIPSGEAS